ncbi:MAG: hypothetical protein ACLFVP_08595 [Candidatus Bathyarchaeia archaeon]
MLAQVTLTPAEGKRLIAKAIPSLDVVQDALEYGTVVIATSTSTAYVLEELQAKELENKGLFTAGVVTADECGITDPESRYKHQVIKGDKISSMNTTELRNILAEMGSKDVFIKGANAIDPSGAAGILLGGEGGGTIGAAWGHLTSQGVNTIIAVGLEKLVPIFLSDIVPKYGRDRVDLSLGWKCGMMIVQGTVITEIEAFHTLFDIEATPIAGGGIQGAEGCKIYLLEGEEKEVKTCFDLVKEIKGEPQLKTNLMPQ